VTEISGARALLNLRIMMDRFDPMIAAVRQAREAADRPGLRDDLDKLQVSLERARKEVAAAARKWGSGAGTIWAESPPTPQQRPPAGEQSRDSALRA
jgi:hypothetical protein